MFRLDNKTAIVTGGAHGIGRAICEIFAQQGASVLIVDLDAEAGETVAADIRTKGQAASFFRADVSDASEAEKAVKLVAEKTGRIDILCNNAAYLAQFHALMEASDDEWRININVGLIGAANYTRATLPYMIPHRGGSIINVASVQGMTGAHNSAPYTTVKHGIIGLSRSIAADYGTHNIRCNALCPGPIQTRISPAPGTEWHNRQIAKTLLARTGDPREVANVAAFLASDEASYVTGAIIAVDGGWTAT